MTGSPAPSDTLRRLLDAQRYEEALGVAIGEGRQADAFRLKQIHINSIELVKRLNSAESKLQTETEEDQRTRIRSIGIALANENRPTEAIPYLEYLWKVAPTANSAFELAAAHNNAGESADAGRLISWIITRKSQLLEPYRRMLVGLEARQEAEQERLVRMKAEQERRTAEQQERLARQKAEQERRAAEQQERLARQKAEQERRAAAQAEAERRAEEHVCRGIALYDKQDWQGAVGEYREALRLKPGQGAVHNNLGDALQAKHDLEGAIREYREALRLKPDIHPEVQAAVNVILEPLDRKLGNNNGLLGCGIFAIAPVTFFGLWLGFNLPWWPISLSSSVLSWVLWTGLGLWLQGRLLRRWGIRPFEARFPVGCAERPIALSILSEMKTGDDFSGRRELKSYFEGKT